MIHELPGIGDSKLIEYRARKNQRRREQAAEKWPKTADTVISSVKNGKRIYWKHAPWEEIAGVLKNNFKDIV